MSALALLAVVAAGCTSSAEHRRVRAARDRLLSPHLIAVERHVTGEAIVALDDSALRVRELVPTGATRQSLHRAEYDAASGERRVGSHLLGRDREVIERAILHESIRHIWETTKLIDADAFDAALAEPCNAALELQLKTIMLGYSLDASRRRDERIAFTAEEIVYADVDVTPAMYAVFARVPRKCTPRP